MTITNIRPRTAAQPLPCVECHKAEPIKNKLGISALISFCLRSAENAQSKENKHRWMRNALLFTLGFNLGVRVSDLVRFRFCDFIDDDFNVREQFRFIEQKTSTTRGRKTIQCKNEFDELCEVETCTPTNRICIVNDAIQYALCGYLNWCSNTGIDISLDDYLFVSTGRNKVYETLSDGTRIQRALSRQQVDTICQESCELAGLRGHFSTHMLRKTFAYHILAKEYDSDSFDQRQLMLLQVIFGHSSAANTLRYAGVTDDEVRYAYLNLNLGLECWTAIATTDVEPVAVVV